MSELARGCLLDRDSTDYLMAALGGVTEEQSWGLGSLGATAFKGGWWAKSGESAFEVRQVGLMTASDGNLYVIAITAWPREESLEAGQILVEEVAAWIVSAPEPAPCGA